MDYLRLVLVYLIAASLGGYVLSALAAPEDDYREGLRAFKNGDIVGAMPPLRKAAEVGHAPSQALFGLILERAGSDREALEYYRKAAEQGNVDGEYALGMMFVSGQGVKRDPKEGVVWIARAAEKGHREAINALADAYIKGEGGLAEAQPNPKEALRWIRRAADNNYVPALEHLARAHRSGLLGLAVDAKQAELYEARVRELRGVTAKPKTKSRK